MLSVTSCRNISWASKLLHLHDTKESSSKMGDTKKSSSVSIGSVSSVVTQTVKYKEKKSWQKLKKMFMVNRFKDRQGGIEGFNNKMPSSSNGV